MSSRHNNAGSSITHQMARDWFPPGNYQNQAMTIAVHATVATTPASFDYMFHMATLTSGLPALGFWFGISNAAQMCAGTGTVKLMSNSGWPAFTSGAHKYVWTYDGNSGAPGITAYLDNVAHNSSANNPTVGSVSGPWEFMNRSDAGGYRPVDGTTHEVVIWNSVLSSQDRTDYQNGVDPRLIAGGPIRHYRMVNGVWYELVTGQIIEYRAASVAFSSLTGTPARGHAAVQEHTRVPALWFAEPSANTPVLRLPGPAIDSDGRTLCKRLRVGAISGGVPQFGEKIYQGTDKNAVFGYFLGVVPIGTNDNFIVLFNPVGIFSATTGLTGQTSGITATPSEVADCLAGPQGALKAIAATGGSGTFTFGEDVRALQPITIAAGTWTAATNTLTSTGAFTGYTFNSGDQIYIATGTGHTSGFKTIASRVSNDAITLTAGQGMSASDNSNTTSDGIRIGTGKLANETGGVVYLYGFSGNTSATMILRNSAATVARTTAGAPSDYTPTVSRFTGTAWSYSTGAGTVTDVSPTSATDAAGPTTATIPTWYTVTTSLVGFFEPGYGAWTGNRLIELTDRSGNKNHMYPNSVLSMPSKGSFTEFGGVAYDYISMDQGRSGTQPTRVLSLGATTNINRNALTIAGVFWRRNTRYAGSLFSVANVEVRTDSEGRAIIRINGVDFTPTPAVYLPSRPFFLILRVNGAVKELWICSDFTSESTSFSNATGPINQLGSDATSLTNDDFFNAGCLAVHNGALTDGEIATIKSDLVAKFGMPATWKGVIMFEGSSTAEGTGGEIVSAGTTGNNQNRDLVHYLLQLGACKSARVFKAGVFAHTFTNMDARKTQVAAIMTAYTGPWEIVSVSAINDIASGTAPATVAANSLAYHGAMRTLVPGVKIVAPKLFPRSYSGGYEANRLTYIAYSPGEIGVDRFSDITVAASGYFDALPSAAADYTGAGFAGDGLHLSLLGASSMAGEMANDVGWGITPVVLGGVRTRYMRNRVRVR